MSKFYFTTVLSNAYLYKGLCLYQSLQKYCRDFKLFTMCTDKEAYEVLKAMKLPNMKVLQVKDVENHFVAEAKRNRSYLEFCWTLKPVTLYYVMWHYRDAEYYGHLDADLYFFGKPDDIFKEAPNADLYLTDHNNSEKFLRDYETSGRFNTGFVGCRNSPTARKAVEWWRRKCLKECPSAADTRRKLFGDQRYVERWPEDYPNVHVVKGKGVNVAVWNFEKYGIFQGDNGVYIDSDRLIFYHFSGLCILDGNEFSLTWHDPIPNEVLHLIYIPYMECLHETIEKVKVRFPAFTDGFHHRALAPNIHVHKL